MKLGEDEVVYLMNSTSIVDWDRYATEIGRTPT